VGLYFAFWRVFLRGSIYSPNKKSGAQTPPKRRNTKRRFCPSLYNSVVSLSGSPVAIDVKIDNNAVVAEMPRTTGHSMSIMLTASVPMSATKLWQKVRNALIAADFQNDFVILSPPVI
jgi:hypothetical protein